MTIFRASYTWGFDAARQSAQKDEDLIEECLYNVARSNGFHINDLRKQFIKGVVKNWGKDEFTQAAFAHLNSYQFTEMQGDIKTPEAKGRISFAGEHTENPHGWIDAAIRSGIRAAYEVHSDYY